MALCLQNLEERKEQETGNKRNIEQAVNDVKVKCHFILYRKVIFQGETFCFLSRERPRHLLLLRRRVYCLCPSQYITLSEGRGRVSKGLVLIP